MLFVCRLAEVIKAEGGIHTMILTHIDDISDHQLWKDYFPNMQRVIHVLDSNLDTKQCEIILDPLQADDWEVDEDVHIFHTPVSPFSCLQNFITKKANTLMHGRDILQVVSVC